MSTLKIRRAIAAAKHPTVKSVPSAQDEIIRNIPPGVIEHLPSRLIAELMDGMHEHWERARAHETAEIISEGGVWDGDNNRFARLAHDAQKKGATDEG